METLQAEVEDAVLIEATKNAQVMTPKLLKEQDELKAFSEPKKVKAKPEPAEPEEEPVSSMTVNGKAISGD
jgi:hypothetical protein